MQYVWWSRTKPRNFHLEHFPVHILQHQDRWHQRWWQHHDQRVRDHLITREISVGDYVLTGGELAAAIISDAVIRLVPGVISDEQSALSDCFQDDILSAPIYTRPSDYKGWKVPEILLSGNEAKIRQWEFDQAMERTKRLRPDLLEE